MSVFRPLIPTNPFGSESAWRRFRYTDVDTLSPSDLWAERQVCELALAARLALRVKPQIIEAWPDVVDDRRWLVGRIRALTREQERRGTRG